MTENIKRWFFDVEDSIFSMRRKLDLAGIVKREDLVCDDLDSREHATAYHAVWCRNLRELFREIQKTGVEFENFIDIGSGKGKACFYAAGRMRFKRIVGIEFSLPLVKIAHRNNERFPDAAIQFHHADAMNFILPPGNSIVFLFNPFDDVMLDRFARNNIAHFRTHDSVVAYANDMQRRALAKLGFEVIFRNQTRKISLHRLPK